MKPEHIELYRNTCEARHVLNLPTKEARRAYLDMVEKKRGAQARKYLEDEVMRLHRAAKAAA
jgi:hypothetical protein